jgi:hypothetical protein
MVYAPIKVKTISTVMMEEYKNTEGVIDVIIDRDVKDIALLTDKSNNLCIRILIYLDLQFY